LSKLPNDRQEMSKSTSERVSAYHRTLNASKVLNKDGGETRQSRTELSVIPAAIGSIMHSQYSWRRRRVANTMVS
jgi:hypothetical protein